MDAVAQQRAFTRHTIYKIHTHCTHFRKCECTKNCFSRCISICERVCEHCATNNQSAFCCWSHRHRFSQKTIQYLPSPPHNI